MCFYQTVRVHELEILFFFLSPGNAHDKQRLHDNKESPFGKWKRIVRERDHIAG